MNNPSSRVSKQGWVGSATHNPAEEIVEEYGYWLGRAYDDKGKLAVHKKGEALQALHTALVAGLPKELSPDNLDPKEKINRVEYAKFCVAYNQALNDVKQQLNEFFGVKE